MPAILERLVKQLEARGVANARAAAVEQLQRHGILEKGSDEKLTRKGVIRNAMSPEERAVSRAIKASGGRHRPSEYSYSAKTNRATLKRR